MGTRSQGIAMQTMASSEEVEEALSFIACVGCTRNPRRLLGQVSFRDKTDGIAGREVLIHTTPIR